MALDVRVAVSGELFDGGVERVHHFSKVQRCEEKREGFRGKGEDCGRKTLLSTRDKSFRALGRLRPRVIA